MEVPNLWLLNDYWARQNNDSTATPQIRDLDRDVLREIGSDHMLWAKWYTNAPSKLSPQTISFWGWLGELGIALLKNENQDDIKLYLDSTEGTGRAYYYKLVKHVTWGKTALLQYTTWFHDKARWTIKPGDPFPFNGSSSYAFFLAVRNDVHKKLYGTPAVFEEQIAYLIYGYLQTQIMRFQTSDGWFIKWYYRAPFKVVDDISHAGFAARHLMYGVRRGMVWAFWGRALFPKQAALIVAKKPKRMDFTGGKWTRGGVFFWELPENIIPNENACALTPPTPTPPTLEEAIAVIKSDSRAEALSVSLSDVVGLFYY